MQHVYENWNRRVRGRPAAVARPADERELARVVVEAGARGHRVKAVGSGHSFNEIMITTGTLVDMSRFDRLISVDPVQRLVRVQAGMKLHVLVRELERHDLALPNIGAWMEQTIGGVMATATHGTGGRWKKNLTDAVVAYRLVDGRGNVRTVTDEDLQMLPLGYFGIVTELLLQCVPIFDVVHRRRVTELRRSIDALDETLESHDFVDLRFAGSIPRGALSTWDVTFDRDTRSDRIRYGIEGARQYAINRAVQAFANLPIPRLLSRHVYDKLADVYIHPGDYPPKRAVWWKGLTFNSHGFAPAHDEFEFALPIATTRELLHEVADYMRWHGDAAPIEVQIRFSEATDIVLAPNRDRRTMWFNLNVFDLQIADRVVCRLSQMVRAHGGRPHWCKCIPEIFVGDPVDDIGEWETVREGYDPDGLFLNAYYERCLRPSIEGVAHRPASARAA